MPGLSFPAFFIGVVINYHSTKKTALKRAVYFLNF